MIPDDKEEMALTINAKKRKLKRSDFDSLAKNLKIPARAMENTYANFAGKINEANKWINISFLTGKLKEEYKRVVAENAKKIGLL